MERRPQEHAVVNSIHFRGYHFVNRNHRLAALAAATTLALSAQGAIAAQRTDLHRLNVTQVNAQNKAVSARAGIALQARERHAEMLNMDADSNLRELRTSIDKDGTRHIRYQQAGTPFSFCRYTRRHQGMVGGLPQLLGASGFFSLGPRAAGVGNLWLVGDSTFPGQSTAAVTQSGIRAYLAIRREPGQGR